MEPAKEIVETGFWDKLQPWQAVFSVFMYSLGIYGVEDEKALVLYAMLLVTLAFAMVSQYKHQEATKSVVVPWVLEKALKIVSKYLEPYYPLGPEEVPKPNPLSSSTKTDIVADIEAQIAALKAEA